MKTILVISEAYPLPQNAGTHQRTMNFVNTFRGVGAVDLMYTTYKEASSHDTDVFRTVHHLPRVASGSIGTAFLQTLRGRASCLRQRFSNTFQIEIEKLIRNSDYDIIFVRYEFNAQYLIDLEPEIRKKVLVDFDDLATGPLYESMYGIATKYSFKKLWDYRLLQKFERQCISRFRKVIVCTENDKNTLLKNQTLDQNKVLVVPNIVDDAPFSNYSFQNGFYNPHKLVFVGSLNYKANVEAITWFVKNIFLPFKEAYQDAVLDIVGKDPKPGVLELSEHQGVYIHANVPDVRPFYQGARAIVIPVLWGGGTRIKVLEGALTHRPMLSTSFGVEGLEMEDGKEYLAFEGAEAFIKQYKLLESEFVYRGLAENAFKRVQETYSLETFRKAVEPICKDM